MIASFINLNSQTIDADWYYKAGHEIHTAFSSNAQIFPRPEEGMNKTWDFSQANFSAIEDNFVFEDPQSFDLIDSFPSSTIGAKDLINNFYSAYYEVDGSDLLYWGFTTETNDDTPFYVIYFDPVTIMEGPLSFGESFEDSYAYNSYYDKEFSGNNNGMRKTTFVGTGTVITPTGTFDNCIMTKVEDVNDLNPPSIIYNFYKGTISNIVASYRENGVSTTGEPFKYFSYQTGNLNWTATKDLEELQAEIMLINNTSLKIKSDKSFFGQLDLYTLDGKLISNHQLDIQQGDNFISMPQGINGLCIAMLTNLESKVFQSYKLNFPGKR